ncbi:Fanconi anemia group M protein like [Pseudolycoriella hygida]|uniref:Fanconi anemia group M protein like n=1 Tax=Pseudolycoriella hygida TaxID=35572 RepID=A0A9Q0MZF4_9DIPT|nr:Fanconi anemia group M protein like [Pseudolycoriella hygida]
MATELNIDKDSQDLWEISNTILENYNEDNVLKHLNEKSELRTDRHSGFDNNSGDCWIYPTNFAVRKYQHDIVYNALFKNTLVCLPTGLGKTFIAAVVMYNFYRWYPQGKIIFMAPTKPLVSQQIEACFQVMGISKEDTAEITGQQKKENRLKQWQSKRVFYATPQSVVSDIEDPNFPIKSIKLVVIDEAHKAKGKYAYCEVIRIIKGRNEMFRVLALSATPGRKTNDVAEVVHNLLISHIEVRTEKCPDVVPYIHRKQIETIVVRLTDKIKKYHDELMNIIDPYVQNLIEFDVIAGSTNSLNRGWLVIQKQKYQSSCLVQTHPHHSAVMTDFACCISLYHGLELLERHGLWPFVNYFDSSDEKFIVAKDFRLRQFLATVREDIGTYPFANGLTDVVVPSNFDFGHPKYDELQKCLSKNIRSDCQSQAIVFCEFRDSAFLIHQLLLRSGSHIKPAIFIGQGSTSGQKGITQKQQIATMAEFRKGTYNVLIATCVAEEGIDCGEVDLIVCFDVTSKNPTRLVQRMGRTGRKRNGKVCLLVTEGKEHNNLKDSLSAKEYTNKKLVTHSEVVDCLVPSPRLVPSEFDPKCVETFIQTGFKSLPKKETNVRVASQKRTSVQPPSSSSDLRNFFQPLQRTIPTSNRRLRNDLSKRLLPPSPSACETKGDLNERLEIPTFWEVIADERIPNSVKTFAIKRNVALWKDKFTAKTLSSNYESLIANLLDDPECVSNLVSQRQFTRRGMISISELNIQNEPYDPLYSAKLHDRFMNMRKMTDIPSAITPVELIVLMNDGSVLDDSSELSQTFVPFCNEIESKYQVKDPNASETFGFNSPVRVRKTPLKSSTPFTSKKSRNISFGSVKDSPLLRAFEKCKSLNESKKKKTKLTLEEALAFLGLTDVMDIFGEPLENANGKADVVTVQDVPIEEEMSYSNHNDIVDATNRQTIPTGVPSQSADEYTISQILKIVNQSADQEILEKTDSSRKDKSVGKEIFIGTIEDIFSCCDDIEDEVVPNDNQSAIEEVEEEEIIASSQPVISDLKLPSKYVSHTEIRKTFSLPQFACNEEDMFASFSKTNSSTASNLTPNQNDSKDTIPATPKSTSRLTFGSPNVRSPDLKSPSASTLTTVERSPSVFKRKINMSRLRALCAKSNSERLPINSPQCKSPVFFSCNNLNERVRESDDDDEQTKLNERLNDNDCDIDETFRIHRNPKRKNRVINDTIIEHSSPKTTTKSKEVVFRKPKKRKKMRCNFIDDECDVSGGSSDEDVTLDGDMTSIICNDDVQDDPSVDMRAIYLRSVMSPVRKNKGRFSNPKPYNKADIFSQVVEDNESDYDTSFVVDECSEEEGNDQEMSVLERAEWLLKMERREKRKKSNNNSSSVPKRRKIVEINDSSDENM